MKIDCPIPTLPARSALRLGKLILTACCLSLFALPAWGQDALSIDAKGNVGIGTSNPSTKLEVNGPAKFAGAGNTVTIDGKLGIGTGAMALVNALEVNGSTKITGPANTLIVDGAVGIGTTTLGNYKLTVNGGVKASTLQVDGNASILGTLTLGTGSSPVGRIIAGTVMIEGDDQYRGFMNDRGQTVLDKSGLFSVTVTSNRRYEVKFTTAFKTPPIVVATCAGDHNNNMVQIEKITTSQIIIMANHGFRNTLSSFNFIVVGE